MSDTEELHIGDFNPSTYEHVLPEGAHDFDDYDSDYAEQHPELGFTDEQVEAEVEKLDPDDKKFYEEYRGLVWPPDGAIGDLVAPTHKILWKT